MDGKWQAEEYFQRPTDSHECFILTRPEIRFPDNYMYLISTPGKLTKKSLKAQKNCDDGLHIRMGFVSKITVAPADILVVYGQVTTN